jgi:hypothetical protein
MLRGRQTLATLRYASAMQGLGNADHRMQSSVTNGAAAPYRSRSNIRRCETRNVLARARNPLRPTEGPRLRFGVAPRSSQAATGITMDDA